MTESTCYLFAGGGTGGHLTPGLAVAAELRAAEPECRVLFVGTDRPVERELIARSSYEHVALTVESSAMLWRNPPKFAWRNWRAYRASKRLLEERRLAAVIGLGGFASVPLVWAASRSGVPTLLLEQNTIPGRSTRWLARRANVVCTAFDETRSLLPGARKVEMTGNPVRREFAALCDSVSEWPDPVAGRATGEPVLLVLGGSQGAAGLNDAVLRLLDIEPSELSRCRFIHQSGPAQREAVAAAYERRAISHLVEPFFDDVASLIGQATLAISRAGATTLAELACAGCPAVLVPYPHAADNHQFRNAQAYASAGGSRIVLQQNDPARTAELLAEIIRPLLHERDRLAAMRSAQRSLARPDAARRVVEVLHSLTGRSIK